MYLSEKAKTAGSFLIDFISYEEITKPVKRPRALFFGLFVEFFFAFLLTCLIIMCPLLYLLFSTKKKRP